MGGGDHYSDKGGHRIRSEHHQSNHSEHWKKEARKEYVQERREEKARRENAQRQRHMQQSSFDENSDSGDNTYLMTYVLSRIKDSGLVATPLQRSMLEYIVGQNVCGTYSEGGELMQPLIAIYKQANKIPTNAIGVIGLTKSWIEDILSNALTYELNETERRTINTAKDSLKTLSVEASIESVIGFLKIYKSPRLEIALGRRIIPREKRFVEYVKSRTLQLMDELSSYIKLP